MEPYVGSGPAHCTSLFVCVSLPFSFSLSLSLSLSVCVCVCVFPFLSLSLSVCVFLSLSLSLSVCLSLSLSLSLPVCVFLSLFLSLFGGRAPPAASLGLQAFEGLGGDSTLAPGQQQATPLDTPAALGPAPSFLFPIRRLDTPPGPTPLCHHLAEDGELIQGEEWGGCPLPPSGQP
uniref:Uncharacterized protein n=1 Tax=Pipistrellus kuhlii TaxID=59472 RepID=A0A7J7RME1_PIPKU|nr:hypothetical protein mPipKuh1_010399 [Pipistrellus kuhlii]